MDFEYVKGVGETHKYLAGQIMWATTMPALGGTESFTPKREYNIAPKVVPGYLVWQPNCAGQFQLTLPKRRKWEKYMRRYDFEFSKGGPGDHERWRRGAQTVHVNYKNGEVDLASVKAVARVIGKPVGAVFQEMKRT